MVRRDHPFWHLKARLLNAQPELVLEYSTYVYREYGITESRLLLNIEAKRLSEKWLEEQISGLRDGQELAIHSRVRFGSKTFHVPMIDFVNTTSSEQISKRVKRITEDLKEDIWIFNSGRSLHGYFFLLVEEDAWLSFLGRLLLCNSRGEFPDEIVDSRWIGHSLEHGFSALRWSQNTRRHPTTPSLLTDSSRDRINEFYPGLTEGSPVVKTS